MSRLLLSLLTCRVAIAATAAPWSPAARAEIDGLLARLVASGCEFNRNGRWYAASEAKSHLSQKLKYLEDRGMVQTTEQFIAADNLGPWLTLSLFLFICFLAGFFLDWISILLIFIPVFMPIINKMGFDPVWFCVLFLIIIQTSYLSPPMAPAIFYLRGIAPPEITIHHMFRGVVPFIVLQLLTLVFTIAFPPLVLWLPSKLLGFK